VTLALAPCAGARVLSSYARASDLERCRHRGEVDGLLIYKGLDAARELGKIGYPCLGGNVLGKGLCGLFLAVDNKGFSLP
jgi:hypothetical protein